MRQFAVACLALLLLPSPSLADCADDLQQLKPRIDRIKSSDKPRYALANKWFGQAEKAAPDDEVQCHNFYIKASRALTQPMNQASNGGAADRSGEGAGTSAGPPPAHAPGAHPAPPPFAPPKSFFGFGPALQPDH